MFIRIVLCGRYCVIAVTEYILLSLFINIKFKTMKKLPICILGLLMFVVFSLSAQNAQDVVIPIPNSVVTSSDSVVLFNKFVSISEDGAPDVAKYLKQELEVSYLLEVRKLSKIKRHNMAEFWGTEISIVVDDDSSIASEGYVLDIDDDIKIIASTQTGAFYGVQTLFQLMKAGERNNGFVLSAQKIEDAPRFSWRSYMLDESRYFLGEEQVYRLLDAMAALKLNVFHWHLTDDAGWRLEIKKYPKLTEVGSKRIDTEIGTWGSNKTSGVPHEGFYTQKQVKKILKYAKDRHIKVVPEIEMPGHASAAIASYPWLGTKNVEIEVPVKFGKHYHIYDVIDPRVQEFMKDVVSEVIELFDADVIHIGGDEVRFNHWEEDDDMVAHKKKMNYSSFMDIQIEFTNDMSRYIEEQGCSMMGWNEILGKNLHTDDNIKFAETSTKVAPNVIVQFWKGDLKDLSAAAKQGYRLVNSYHRSTYLDYSHSVIPLEKAYAFDPIPAGLDKEYHSNIIGFGSQMWREWAPTVKHVQAQTFPRIAAYSEVGWSSLENKNYDSFLLRLAPIIKRWREYGINVYHKY